MKNYAGWLTLTVWRKKCTLLGVLLILGLLLIFNYYQSAGEWSETEESEIARVANMQDKRSLLGGSSVKFIKNLALGGTVSNMPEEGRGEAEVGEGGEVSRLSKAPYIPKYRLLHLDLKGAPPSLDFIKKLFKLSAGLGATGVLLEWEDTFPWSGPLASIRFAFLPQHRRYERMVVNVEVVIDLGNLGREDSDKASNAYTRAEVNDILGSASEHGLEVIPLIQTFGHVEFALKHSFLSHLREVPDSAQALCPSLNTSMDFVTQMIEQVMEVHNDSKFLHIGCDEVFQMGECSRCRVQPRENLFLNHVTRVAGLVRSNYKHVTPIIWDDMLRHLALSNLEQYHIGELVEPMVWVYAEDVYRFVPYSVWDKYAAVFPRVWAASAFKGAFGEHLYVPNVKRHLENNIRWLDVMSNEGSKFKEGFQGIALTGWQRYDHFSVLCELLPAAVPSLAVTLTATTHGFLNSSLRQKINEHLDCGVFGHQSFNLNNDPFLWDAYARCTFPGHSFFKLTYRFNVAEKEANELIDMIRKKKGWMTPYNVRHNFSTPLRVEELMQEQPRIYHSMSSLSRAAREALEGIFDFYTIGEWVEQNIYPYTIALEEILKDANALKARRVWPARPLPVLKDLRRYGIQVSKETSEDASSPR